MKNLIICLLLSCSFLFGVSITVAAASELDGGVEVMIYASKTGKTVCSFELPKGYHPKSQTVEITLTDGKGIAVYTVISKELTISLPANLSGNFNLSAKVNGIIFSQKIIL